MQNNIAKKQIIQVIILNLAKATYIIRILDQKLAVLGEFIKFCSIYYKNTVNLMRKFLNQPIRLSRIFKTINQIAKLFI